MAAQLRVAVVAAVLRLTFRLGLLLILCRLFRQHHSRSRAGKAGRPRQSTFQDSLP